MSRFFEGDYDDEWYHLAIGRWERNVRATINGKKGQKLLAELEEALLGMPERRLVASRFTTPKGEVCALGALCAHHKAKTEGISFIEAARQLSPNESDDPNDVDEYEEYEETIHQARLMGMTLTMAWEIGYLNDDYWGSETPEERWQKVLDWVRSKRVRPSA